MDTGVSTRLFTRVSRTSPFRPTHSPSEIILKIAISTDLTYSDCSAVTTENSEFCVFFLIRYADSVALVTLTATFLSLIVNIQWEIGRLAVSVNFSNVVTVPVVFLSEGWLTKTVIVFVVLGDIFRASSVRIG